VVERSDTTGIKRPTAYSIPKGSQRVDAGSLRDAKRVLGWQPVVALRLPPANGSNPVGVNTTNQEDAQ